MYPDVKPFGYYWSSQPNYSAETFENWCEWEDGALKLPFTDQYYKESDQQEAENLISNIKFFLKTKYNTCGIDLSLFGQTPSSYINCKFALWILKNSKDKFLLKDSDESREACYLQYKESGLPPKLAISNLAYYALIRHTKNSLSSKQDDYQNRIGCDRYLINQKVTSASRFLTDSQTALLDPEQKSCLDNCTIL